VLEWRRKGCCGSLFYSTQGQVNLRRIFPKKGEYHRNKKNYELREFDSG
jgi:hypothetical protein